MSQRRAVTKAIATRYKRADKAAKGVILDELGTVALSDLVILRPEILRFARPPARV